MTRFAADLYQRARRRAAWTIVALAVSALLWPRPLMSACSYTSPAPRACTHIKLEDNCRAKLVDLDNTQLDQTSDPVPANMQPAQAATLLNVCEPLQTDPTKPDYGEDYLRRLFARFAYNDLFGMGMNGDPQGAAALQKEAIDSLTNLQRGNFGLMGTDSFSPGLVGAVKSFLTDNANRKGDGDVTMLGLTTVLIKYGTRLPPAVYAHVLNDLIDLSPGLGSVETLSYGANPLTAAAVCATACLPSAGTVIGYAICVAACGATVAAERVVLPETENHITMIYVLQYLKNQLLFDATNSPSYDNARNGYRTQLLNRLRGFVRNDFVEYNAHNYQDFEMFALLNLFSYAEDPAVKTAAKMVLDYISAKVAVSSEDARRSTPFRRHNDISHGYFCDELLQQHCTDPQAAWYMTLGGATGFLVNNNTQDWNVPPSPAGAPLNDPSSLPNYNVPETYSVEFQWAQSAGYTLDPLIKDLFVKDPSHKTFYQFFHYSNTQRLSGSINSNDELYFGSPSYLISAGGHPNDFAYTMDLPFPISLAINNIGLADDLGVAAPTTLMPIGNLHSRAQMIRFSDSNGENLCVWRNFACGLNPVIPANYVTSDPGPISMPQPGSGSWSFFDESGGPLAKQPGYYVAVYQQEGFGFLEVYDTWLNPQGLTSLNDFANKLYGNNNGKTFSQTGVNTWKVIAGSVIQFTADAKITTVDGKPPYDPNRTNGDVINNDGAGVVTITNPTTGATLPLDASVPPNHPSITVPGPLNFPNTCVGATNYATLNVCNDTTGSDGLFVYNILSQNTQFPVTEPSSGYPTSIGPNFCFPFQAQFAPMVTGAISSKVTISNSDPNVPELKVNVAGTGIQQSLATVISNSGDFGNVCVGSFADLNLTINNTGGCALVISKVTSSSGDFTVAGALSFPLTIGPGNSLSVPIRFHPSGLGRETASITVASNDPNMPNAVVPVSGNAPPPVINASIANSGAFGNVCAGTQEDLTLQVVNQGLCPLTISGINSAGGSSFVLPSVPNYPVVLGASASVNLPIRFQPPAYGSPSYISCSNTVPQTANIVIHNNDPKYPDPAGFVTAVNGIEGCPKLVLSPQNLTGAFAFPATVSDPNGTLGCYTDRQITAGNSGICPLTIASLTTANGLDGKGLPLAASPLEFKVTNPTVPITIAPGAAPVPITVRFKPVILTDQNAGAPDQQTGTLAIVSNDPVPADNAAGLCGEPTYQSGARVLVVNTTNNPVSSVANLTLSSQGLTPPFRQSLMPATLLSAPNICGNTILYQLDNETLRPAGTTGNNPRASYSLSAKNGSTQANMSFTLGQCQVEQVVLQIK